MTKKDKDVELFSFEEEKPKETKAKKPRKPRKKKEEIKEEIKEIADGTSNTLVEEKKEEQPKELFDEADAIFAKRTVVPKHFTQSDQGSTINRIKAFHNRRK